MEKLVELSRSINKTIENNKSGVKDIMSQLLNTNRELLQSIVVDYVLDEDEKSFVREKSII